MVVYFNDKGKRAVKFTANGVHVCHKNHPCEISPNKGSKFKPFMWEDGPNLWIVCHLVYK